MSVAEVGDAVYDEDTTTNSNLFLTTAYSLISLLFNIRTARRSS